MWKRRISSKTVNICRIYSSLEEAFEFCWSWLADEHNTLPKSTRRHLELDKFVFGTPWLPDVLCKHWFASSVWNFCSWVADVPPRETSPAAKSEEKRMFSQASVLHADRKVDVNQTCQQSVFSTIGACMRIWLMHSGCRGTAVPNVCLTAFSLFPLPSSPRDQRPCSQANDGMGKKFSFRFEC